MLNVTLIGLGAIGSAIVQGLAHRHDIRIIAVIVPASRVDVPRPVLDCLSYVPVLAGQFTDTPPADLVVECAGHRAIEAHVLPALSAGVPCVVTSVGALATPGLPERLDAAARKGNTRLELLSGAIGAIDALAAARLGGLDEVTYTGRKPPAAWLGTPAQQACDLEKLTKAVVIFEGSARDAAIAYPRNANVAATVALAGVGFEQTRVRLIADPGASGNVHHVQACGAFGEFEITLTGRPLAANPRTSALTVYSAMRAIVNRAGGIVI
jgi:aspartate dehydrogenase